MELKSSSTADLLADRLRAMINSGTLAEGARLVERELAARFSVSRVPMREAIRQLEQEGLVAVYLNRGAVVRTLSLDDIRELYHLRALLEGDALFHSAKNMDAETLARAELVHRLLGEAVDAEKQAALNLEFHNVLYGPCSNPRQLAMITSLRNQVERYERLQHRLVADTPKFQHQHAAMLAACRAGDAVAARRAAAEHIHAAGEVLQDFMRHERQ